MSKKKIIIIVAVIILLGGGAAVAFIPGLRGGLFGGGQQEKTIQIPTKSGNVKVKDFNEFPIEKTEKSTVLENSNDFSITHFPEDNSFVILLLAEPFSSTQKVAEEFFLFKLGITKAEACQLNVTMKVPYSVNPTYSGNSYAMTFCPPK